MFTTFDWLAAGLGLVFAVFATFVGPKTPDGSNGLLGYASGTAAGYLLLMAYGVAMDRGALDVVLHANSTLLFGALLYGAAMNLRTCPGVLPAWHGFVEWCKSKLRG